MTLEEKYREIIEDPECIRCGAEFDDMDALTDHVSDECDLLTRAMVYGVNEPKTGEQAEEILDEVELKLSITAARDS